MSSSPSRKCSRNPRLRCRNSGIALVSVLWLLLLLSALAATVAYIVRVEALLTHRALDLAHAQAAADAAIVNSLSALSDELVSRRPPIGVWQNWEFEGIAVTIRVSREAGRIDLNAANRELLLALLEVHGVAAVAASRLVDQLRPLFGAHFLETVEELQELPGWLGDVTTASEWIGRVTGDRSKLMLTMRWDHAPNDALAASCKTRSERPPWHCRRSSRRRTFKNQSVGKRDTRRSRWEYNSCR